MNPFSSLPHDEFRIIDGQGEQSEPVKGIMSRNKVTVFDKTINVSIGDKVIRLLPGGNTEKYIVDDCHFQKGMGGIPDHFSITLIREEHKNKTISGQSINISNSSNIIIGDENVQSLNVVMFEQSMRAMVEAIGKSNASEAERSGALDQLRKFLSNPTVAAILGGATSGLLSLIK
ncbi:MAG TPA: hypothetical protein VN419_04670 [Humidesulfovibrio sp.]|uniref:hypothetical protein n=1 Tax=Humidesulfovibrio sp. TaxID=2910988 RepID=UPI002C529C79|nr:hypothetical protein [Humidesulfovibrio sp.]HWR03293.1 hypothetical protein [Humidesulfovibrio sp.]